MDRLKIAQYIALGSTICWILGIFLEVKGITTNGFGVILIEIGFVAGFIAYIFGGLLTAIKMAGRIAKWGWIIVPFPMDIFTFMMAFVLAIVVFFFLPIIPIRKAYKESRNA